MPYYQYVTKPGDCCGEIDPLSSPLAAAEPWTKLSWPEALNASGSEAGRSGDHCPKQGDPRGT
jgi:hypothetical protein